jgi:hypothetical protein
MQNPNKNPGKPNKKSANPNKSQLNNRNLNKRTIIKRNPKRNPGNPKHNSEIQTIKICYFVRISLFFSINVWIFKIFVFFSLEFTGFEYSGSTIQKKTVFWLDSTEIQ